jgi:hypothetical protein
VLELAELAAGLEEEEQATRLATTATDNAAVPPTRRPNARPNVDVFTDFLPRLGVVLSLVTGVQVAPAMARGGQMRHDRGESEPVREPIRQKISAAGSGVNG